MTTPTNPIPSARMRAKAAKALDDASASLRLDQLRRHIDNPRIKVYIVRDLLTAREARIAAGKVLPV